MKHKTQLTLTAAAFLLLGIFIAGVLLPGGRNTGHDSECEAGEEFADFLREFNDNLTFQQQRTRFPLLYVTGSGSEEAEEEMYLIERAQWVPLSVFDSIPTLVQIHPAILSDPDANTCEYLVTITGIHHGQHMVLRFTPEEGKWQLHTFEDYSF